MCFRFNIPFLSSVARQSAPARVHVHQRARVLGRPFQECDDTKPRSLGLMNFD